MFRGLPAVLAMAAVLLSGCSRVDPKIYSQDGPVADGDMLVAYLGIEPLHLMPPLVMDQPGYSIEDWMFDGLTRFTENYDVKPCLAERWTVSKDGKAITYYLRKGVRFQDGVEFTAQDVLFTYKVWSDPKVNTPSGSYYQEIKNVEILDRYTVRVNYKKPYPPALAMTFYYILPKHLLEGQDINKSDFDRHPIGTGPYKFVEWKTAQQIVLEANPYYWEGKPHIQKIIWKIIPDDSAKILALQNREVDWGYMNAEQYSRQTNTPKFTDYYNIHKNSLLAFTFIAWNQKNPLFQDKKVRQALTMAIDRQAILQNVLYGQGSVCTGSLHTWSVNPDVKPWPFDPSKAEEYLKEAGWKPGPDGIRHKTIAGEDTLFKFTLLFGHGWAEAEKIGTIVQQQLRPLGIQVDLQSYEVGALETQFIEPRKFDAFVGFWFMDPDPADNFMLYHSSQMGPHQYNYAGYINPELDRLLEGGRETYDMGKRQKIYWKIHSILNEDQPFTYLYNPMGVSAIHKRFKNFQISNFGIMMHPEQWYVPADQQKYSVTP